MAKTKRNKQHLTDRARVKRVELATLDLTIVVRASRLDPGRVEQYVEAMRNGDQFPPVVVFRDTETGQLWLADGHHRVEAAGILGLIHIDAIIMDGDWRRAFLYALTLGRDLRRSNADKQHCVEIMLEDPTWVDLSDAAIGRHAAVSPKTVRAARERLGLVTAVRRTSDGRVMNVSRMGPRPPSEPKPTTIREIPECSPPAVGSEPDVVLDLASDGTPMEVHDGVRKVEWRIVSSGPRTVIHGRVARVPTTTTRHGDVISTTSDGSHIVAAIRKLRGE